MAFTTRIRKRGGEAIVTIPPELLAKTGLEVGSQVSLTVDRGSLIICPASARRRRYTMKELLRGAAAVRRLNAEIAWAREGAIVGQEVA